MRTYILHRLVATIFLAWAVATIVFVFMRMVPGDPAAAIAGDTATPDQIEQVREDLGLAGPWYGQYARWMGALLRGDLGTSVISNTPVANDLFVQLPRTLELALVSVVIAVAIGVPLGIWAAVHRGRFQDHVTTVASLAGLSVPGFVLGSLLVLVLAVNLGWLPATGYVAFRDDPAQHLKHLAMPAVSLGLPMAAVFVRYTRSTVLDVLGRDYVRTARAKGLRPTIVLYRHAVRNALIPVVTLLGLELGGLLGGTVIIEFIFSWPGLSTMLARAISQRDYPVVQSVVLLIALIFIFLNLLVDVVNGLLDPRIRY